MGGIGYIAERPARATTAPQKDTERGATVNKVELWFDDKKDARGLAFEVHSGLCMSAERVANLCVLGDRDVNLLGSLEVLCLYLERLKIMADELCLIIPAGGDVV
jgi:hypothetical protein